MRGKTVVSNSGKLADAIQCMIDRSLLIYDLFMYSCAFYYLPSEMNENQLGCTRFNQCPILIHHFYYRGCQFYTKKNYCKQNIFNLS